MKEGPHARLLLYRQVTRCTIPVLAEPAVPDVKAVIRRAKLDRVSVVAVSIELARRQKSIEGLARGDRGSREQAAEVVEEREWEVVRQRLVDECRARARRPDDEHDRMLARVVHPRVRGAVRGRSAPGRPVSGGARPARGRACVGPPGSPIGGPSTRHRLGRGSSGSADRTIISRFHDPPLDRALVSSRASCLPSPRIRATTVRTSRCGRARRREIVYPTTTTTTPSPCSPAAQHRSSWWQGYTGPVFFVQGVPEPKQPKNCMHLLHVSEPDAEAADGSSDSAPLERTDAVARGHQTCPPGDHDRIVGGQQFDIEPALHTLIGAACVEGALLTDCSWRSVTSGPSAWTIRVAPANYTVST